MCDFTIKIIFERDKPGCSVIWIDYVWNSRSSVWKDDTCQQWKTNWTRKCVMFSTSFEHDDSIMNAQRKPLVIFSLLKRTGRDSKEEE